MSRIPFKIHNKVMNTPKVISCDETGFTGNNMLDEKQRYFGYASTDIGNAEAETIIDRVLTKHNINENALKASDLLRSENGQRALEAVLEEMHGRYIVTLYDKKLSLAYKFFEYIYEPVLQASNSIFYRNNLHRFVGMFFFMLMENSGEGVTTLAQQFEKFMRTLNTAEAPALFANASADAIDPLLEPMLRFARGYSQKIREETKNLEDTANGKWILELSISALHSHLAEWGQRHEIIEVVCGDSKPLRSLTDTLDVMIDRPHREKVFVSGKWRALTWNMSKSIAYASPLMHPAIQLADAVAGAAGAVAQRRGSAESSRLYPYIAPHIHEDCIIPNYEIIDLDQDEALVNAMILQELAQRADKGADPIKGMGFLYEALREGVPTFRKEQEFLRKK